MTSLEHMHASLGGAVRLESTGGWIVSIIVWIGLNGASISPMRSKSL